jgi:hypothetical protein
MRNLANAGAARATEQLNATRAPPRRQGVTGNLSGLIPKYEFRRHRSDRNSISAHQPPLTHFA